MTNRITLTIAERKEAILRAAVNQDIWFSASRYIRPDDSKQVKQKKKIVDVWEMVVAYDVVGPNLYYSHKLNAFVGSMGRRPYGYYLTVPSVNVIEIDEFLTNNDLAHKKNELRDGAEYFVEPITDDDTNCMFKLKFNDLIYDHSYPGSEIQFEVVEYLNIPKNPPQPSFSTKAMLKSVWKDMRSALLMAVIGGVALGSLPWLFF